MYACFSIGLTSPSRFAGRAGRAVAGLPRVPGQGPGAGEAAGGDVALRRRLREGRGRVALLAERLRGLPAGRWALAHRGQPLHGAQVERLCPPISRILRGKGLRCLEILPGTHEEKTQNARENTIEGHKERSDMDRLP